MKILLQSCWILAATFLPAVSFACSLAPGYLQPSNYDLVKQTEAIVVAHALSFDVVPEEKSRQGAEFTFRVLQTLKGNVKRTELAIGGIDIYQGRSADNDFRDARPGAGAGACFAYDYQVGRNFVLFLKKSDSDWIVSGPPFSRISEEVDSINSPWVAVVQQYVRIGAMDNYEAEKAELRKLQDAAKKNSGNPLYPLGLADDIERYFRTPYPTRSYADLIALYNSLPMESRANVVWALASGKHAETPGFIRGLIRSGEFTNYIGQVSAYVERTHDDTTIPDLAAGYLRIRNKQTRWPIMWALIKAARSEHMPAMLAVLKSADEEEAGRLGMWFVTHPDEEAAEIIKNLVADRYADRWALTLSLAGLGDVETLEWARRSIEKSDKDQWIGYHAIAASPLKEADDLAKAVIKNNNQRASVYLVEGYGADGILSINANPNRWDRLRDIVDLPEKSKELGERLTAMLRQMAGRGDEKAKQLLSRLK